MPSNITNKGEIDCDCSMYKADHANRVQTARSTGWEAERS